MHVLLPSVRKALAVISRVKLGPKNYLETAHHFGSGKKNGNLLHNGKHIHSILSSLQLTLDMIQ